MAPLGPASDDDQDAGGTEAAGRTTRPAGRGPSSSSALSEDADAEGEPDDMDDDAEDAAEFALAMNAAPDEDEDEDEDGDQQNALHLEASSPPPSPPARPPQKPLVLKLKLPPSAAALAPPAPRRPIRKPSKPCSPRSRPAHAHGPSALPRRGSDEEDELEEEAVGSDSDQASIAGSHPYPGAWRQFSDEEDDAEDVDADGDYEEDDNEDLDGEDENGSTRTSHLTSVPQLTVRQRAKEYGEPVAELQSLPMAESKRKKELTEADRAMERAEKSRKRKHQNEKKLEDEKTETINRLLKGQVGRPSKGNQGKVNGDIISDETNGHVKDTNLGGRRPPIPTQNMFRYVTSTRSGQYRSQLSIPAEFWEDSSEDSSPFHIGPSKPPGWIRPPPQTCKLLNGMRVAT